MDLYRLLSEQPLAMLRAIATGWQIELVDQDLLQAARQLGDAMLAPGALAGRLQALSPEARQALGVLAQGHGQAAMKSLTLQYGELRRIGPGRLERDRLWDESLSPLEELVYNGLAFRAFGAVPGGHGELLLLPRELLERLPPPTRATPEVSIAPAPEPPLAIDAGLALSEDILAVLSFLRRTQPVAAADDHLTPPAWLLTDERLAQRLVGAPDKLRLALCWRLLWRLRLIEEKRGRLHPSLAARDWLRAPDAARAARLYRAWRDDPRVTELEQVASLLCDPDGCPHNPVLARQRLSQFMSNLTPGAWHSPANLIQALKHSQPMFLRPDGDLTSWFVRDAIGGQYLRGAESWDRVEGALALHLLTRQLHWLGVMALGLPAADNAPTALSLTALGAAILGKDAAVRNSRNAPLAEIGVEGQIRITPDDSAYERYQLERVAIWQEQGEPVGYQLTEESVWEGYNAGITIAQMLAFFKRISGDRLPPKLIETLQTWDSHLGRATLRRATLLLLADQDTADEIIQDRHLSTLIVEKLAATVLVVRDSDVDELVAALKERGIWPQKQDEAP